MSDFEPRQAEPGQQFTVTGPAGEQFEFAADEAGQITPENAEQAAALDAMGVLSEGAAAQAAGAVPAEIAEGEAAAVEASEEPPAETAKGGK